MLKGFFAWLREQSTRAVLAGCEDAAAELGESDASAAEALRERLSPALPPHEDSGDSPLGNGKTRQKGKV